MIICWYARKSNNLKNESIDNQFRIIDSFIHRQKEFKTAKILRFSDDNFTGMNLERDSFQELLALVRKREIDVIIVKDLSRLGRNFLDVVRMTQSIFPFLGVRVIAVDDNYDSNKPGEPLNLPLHIKAVLNEFYVTELSEKSRKSFAHRTKCGSFYGEMAYGYVYSPERKPIIDEEKAKIVREIFAFACDGKSTLEIAKILNERKIPSSKNIKWSIDSVRRMLKNPQYYGKKVGLKMHRDLQNGGWIHSKESDFYVNETAFPPIISKEIFDKVQGNLAKLDKPYVKEHHIMARKLYCAHCGKTLYRRDNFGCPMPHRSGIPPCFPGTVKPQILYPAVLEKVKEFIGGELQNFSGKFSFSDKQKLEDEIDRLKREKGDIYADFVGGITTEDVFTSRRDIVNAKIAEREFEVGQWRKTQAMYAKMPGAQRPIDTLKRLYDAEELTKEHMQFVKRINAFSADNCEIIMQEESALMVLCRNVPLFEEI